jgi:hypothetical protein
MKTNIILVLILTFVSGIAGAAKVIDSRHVYNPGLNACAPAVHDLLPPKGPLEDRSSDAELREAEQLFLNWLFSEDAPVYLQEFDTSLFHYQFIESRHLGASKMGVVIIIPTNTIKPDFYTELGAGLEIPGVRCFNTYCNWINDGEIFSLLVNSETKSVEGFKNWRFENEYAEFDPVMSYYSLLTIHYKCQNHKAEKTSIVHFVDGVARTEIPAWENYPVLLPKGKVSVLAFYCEGQVKGVLCFDMRGISTECPMRFESTVYMKERLGYERILCAQPKCEPIYSIQLIQKTELEEMSSMKWDYISSFKEEIAITH